MNKITIIILILGASVSLLTAQQQTGLSLYNQLAGLYNPSAIPDEYTNDQHNMIVGISARSQWTKLKSSPKTQSIHLEYISDYDNTFNLLLGGYLLNDQAGPIGMTGVYAKLGTIMSRYNPEVGGFSAGIQLGVTQYRINTQSLYEKYPDDIITALNPNVIKPAISIGVSYYNKIKGKGFFDGTHFNTGLSIAQLGFSKHEFSSELKTFNIFTAPHLYAFAKIAKHFRYGRVLELNSWVKYVPQAPVNVDIHTLYHVNKNLWLEIGANSSGLGHLGVGFALFDMFGAADNVVKLSYVYSPSLIQFGSIFGDTHELVLKYAFRT